MQRLVIQGRRRDIGLGSVKIVYFEEAGDCAVKYRRIARAGGDPIAERRKTIGSTLTFKETAIKVHHLNLPTWDNEKHASQWLSSLENHVFPIIGKRAIMVSCPDIMKVLTPYG